jgi:Domain of unknown function (DUF4389)
MTLPDDPNPSDSGGTGEPPAPYQPPSFDKTPSADPLAGGYPPPQYPPATPPAPGGYPPPPASGFPPAPSYSSGGPTGGFGAPANGNDGAPLLLTVVEDHKRSRLTTFFRALLAIPHFIVLYVLNIVVSVVVLLAWFAALFTGRNPAGLRDFTVGVLRWQIRVLSYYFLLTDEYPPFSMDPGGYPIDIEVAPAGHLNRLAVFFRFILAIPAALLSFVVGIVLYVLGLVAWLSGVFAGRVPAGIYGTIAGCLQFYARFSAYHYLITPTYPGQPFGPAQLRPSPTAAA